MEIIASLFAAAVVCFMLFGIYTIAKTDDNKVLLSSNIASNSNDNCNNNLKNLCRMCRAWKEKNNVDIKGITIDVLAYNFLSNYEYKDKSYLYYDYINSFFI